MRRVLFLCSHNAARSQMAEAFLRSLAGHKLIVESAGTIATSLDPMAVRVMREAGIDMSRQRSKSVDEVGEGWDVVVTVCDANCPIPPRSGVKISWRFPDPALAGGAEDERLAAYRRVRDGIARRVRPLSARLIDEAPRNPVTWRRHGTSNARSVSAPQRRQKTGGTSNMQEKQPGKDDMGGGTKQWPADEPGKQGGQGDIGKKGGSGGVGREGDKTGSPGIERR